LARKTVVNIRRIKMKSAKVKLNLLVFFYLFTLLTPLSIKAASCTDGTAIPPFIGSSATPNLLMMLDNSASMLDLAYSSNLGYCYDDSYASGTSYAGYFDSAVWYSYNLATDQFEAKTNPEAIVLCAASNHTNSDLCLNISAISAPSVDNWVESPNGIYNETTNPLTLGAGTVEASWTVRWWSAYIYITSGDVWPGAWTCALGVDCSPGSPYFTLDIAGWQAPAHANQITFDTHPAGVGVPGTNIFLAKGNFLNWLLASKFDIEKSILTGGKYDAANLQLVMESRGCLDKRFIRNITVNDGTSDVTLSIAVRKPESSEQVDANDDTTRFEIYNPTTGSYNNASCQLAIDELAKVSPNQGQLKTYIDACLSDPGGNDPHMSAFNHSIHNCWYMAKHGSWPPGNGPIQNIKPACENIYTGGTDPTTIGADARAYVCNGTYDAGLAHDTRAGYVGRCYSNTIVCTRFHPSGACTAFGPAGWLDGSVCIEEALQDYCGMVTVPEVTDPSDSIGVTGDYWNIPAILADSGVVAQLGDPINIFKAQIQKTTAPEGLLHEFSDSLRMGAMVFNSSGCSTHDSGALYNCSSPPDRDGGRILTYIDEGLAHVLNLVSDINDTKASTWTPLAEAYYNALGYYTQNSSLRLNASDFLMDPSHPDPVEAYCQANNILLISEGASTMDLHPDISTFTALAGKNDGDGDDTANCTDLAGSTKFDDLVYYANNGTAIYPVEPFVSDKQNITTYIVSTGSSRTGLTGECAPSTILSESATNGGTTIYSGENPALLEASLMDAFEAISGRASSGSAASVISSSRGGEGAVYQAVFWPGQTGAVVDNIKWTGDVHSLFVDTYGYLFEDTNSNTFATKQPFFVHEFVLTRESFQIAAQY
jgi:hypothetical protein